MTSRSLRAHLWNGALLLAAGAIALGADRILLGDPLPGPSAGPDVAPFSAPVADPGTAAPSDVRVASDPFALRRASGDDLGVASGGAAPTVPTTQPRGRRLTAILVADERRVAVIDDETVTIGATIAGGARVAAILSDRVWVVEPNGQRHMLTLAPRSDR